MFLLSTCFCLRKSKDKESKTSGCVKTYTFDITKGKQKQQIPHLLNQVDLEIYIKTLEIDLVLTEHNLSSLYLSMVNLNE